MKLKFETVIDTESNEAVTELFNTIANNIASSMDLSLMDKDAHDEVMRHIRESFVYGGLKQLAMEWVACDDSEYIIAMRVMDRSIVEGEKCSM